MPFNTHLFIFIFLPISVFLYYLAAKTAHRRLPFVILIGLSLFCYGWGGWKSLLVLSLSIIFNFFAGKTIEKRHEARDRRGKAVLVFAITCNIGLLVFYKYGNFIVQTAGLRTGAFSTLRDVVVPLAISFFTFQQIAYLIDAHRGVARASGFGDYCLFASFFPTVFSGPIVRYNQVAPQYVGEATRFRLENIVAGGMIFLLGLFQKAALADSLGRYANQFFGMSAAGARLTFFEAWGAALAFTLQIYFDFSGYSDMAVGCARMFGIRLPANFASPYKALNIADFWRRWHISLSSFFRDYLYIPLGGNRGGLVRTYLNLLATMLLCGLWHGASWMFVAWGGMHGIFLIANNAWRRLRKRISGELPEPGAASRALSRCVTFICVAAAWVFFRADNWRSATEILKAMFPLEGWRLGAGALAGGIPSALAAMFPHMETSGKLIALFLLKLVLFGAIALFAPNTQQIMGNYSPVLNFSDERPARYRWKPSIGWAFLAAFAAVAGFFCISRSTLFLYFRF